MLASSKNGSIFAPLKRNNGPLAQLNRAFDYGSKGYRFESCRDHITKSQVLKNEPLAILFFYFAPHLPHRIIKETHKRIRNKALYSSMLLRSGYLSLHLDFTPFSCTSLLPKIIFWQVQPRVNES